MADLQVQLDAMPLELVPWLRLLQLSCPSLPIGAYAYSQGLEAAVEQGWVKDEASAREWIVGLLEGVLPVTDSAILVRAHGAWATGDADAAYRMSRLLLAMRESSELLAEDVHLGRSLAGVLAAQGVREAEPWVESDSASYAVLFALGAVHHGAPVVSSLGAYLFAWAEHQVSAAVRLVPLGQLAGQRVLSSALEAIPPAVERALAVSDDQLGRTAPRLAMASAWHETQYTRLFRS